MLLRRNGRLRQAIERAEVDQARTRDLSVTLSRAWREIRHQVMHADPRHRSRYEDLADAELHIETLNRAMRRGYDSMIGGGVTQQPEPKGQTAGGGSRKSGRTEQASR